jgi:phosphoribosyl-ATP pyrophosphohydrolase
MSIIRELEAVILSRQANPRGDSYTCRLFEQGLDEIVKKVGEEAIEVILAATKQSDERLADETADLMYHLLELLAARGVSWETVETALARRRK